MTFFKFLIFGYLVNASVLPFAFFKSPDGCTAGGKKVGGFCWYLSNSDQSCSSRCTAAGLSYNSATNTYAGTAGTDANCAAVITALVSSFYTPIYAVSCANSWGCFHDFSFGQRCTNATTAAAQSPNIFRACACS